MRGMNDERKYSRLYWSLIDDDRFDVVYPDDRHFGTYCRLLMAADMAWPASTHVPSSCNRRSLQALVDAGIVEMNPKGLFRIHGMDAERNRRAEAGRAGGRVSAFRRANVERPLNGSSTNVEPRRDETSKDETSTTRASVEAFILVRRRVPTPGQQRVIDSYCQTFDLTGEARAEQLILSHPDDPIGALIADLDTFRQERLEAAKVAELPKPKPRRVPKVDAWREDFKAYLESGEPEPAA